MRYRIVYHEKAEGDLDELYEHIALRAGLTIAGNYVGGILDFIDGLKTFRSGAPSGRAIFRA